MNVFIYSCISRCLCITYLNFLLVEYNQAGGLYLLVCHETKQHLSVTRAITLVLGVNHEDGTLKAQEKGSGCIVQSTKELGGFGGGARSFG